MSIIFYFKIYLLSKINYSSKFGSVNYLPICLIIFLVIQPTRQRDTGKTLDKLFFQFWEKITKKMIFKR